MSSNSIEKIQVNAIVVANDLASGLTVYLTEKLSWSSAIESALIIQADGEAENCLRAAKIDEDAALILDPYLVETNSKGEPEHIRERIRVLGPNQLGKTSASVAPTREK